MMIYQTVLDEEVKEIGIVLLTDDYRVMLSVPSEKSQMYIGSSQNIVNRRKVYYHCSMQCIWGECDSVERSYCSQSCDSFRSTRAPLGTSNTIVFDSVPAPSLL